jgi:antitoxin MazE
MQTALRKMGNSTGLIVPRALLSELGVTTGAAMDVRLEEGRIVATPVVSARRAGWAHEAAAVADEPVDADWLSLANESDADLTW